MRSPLKKLLAVVVPVFAALSVSAASASAADIATQTCPKSNQALVSSGQAYHDVDANDNGWVCAHVLGNGRVHHVTDDVVIFTTSP